MTEEEKAAIRKKITEGLLDQKTIRQLSSSGKEAQDRRKELERIRRAREAATDEEAKTTDGKAN